jgi:hypothetical protein
MDFSETTSHQRQPNPRRRRPGRRHGSQGRNSISYVDADMSDLTQSTRTSFKRKASSSSAKTARSQNLTSKVGGKLDPVLPSFSSTSKNCADPWSLHIAGGNPATSDLPLILSASLFEASSDPLKISSSVQSEIRDSSDDDDLLGVSDSLSELASRPFAPDDRFQAGRPSLFSFGNEDLVKRDAASHPSSAVLVMPDVNTENVRYLPLCTLYDANNYLSYDPSILTVIPHHRDRIRESEEASPGFNHKWPLDDLPVELFDLITAHLARDDVKSMRLVNKEFERKVSRSLFHTSVVPFNTELYDMIDEDKRSVTRAPRVLYRSKGKKKVTDPDQPPAIDPGGLLWQNAKDDKEGKMYKGHGLRVFQGFGPHIKRFGMTFEVSEKQLIQPPVKKELERIDAYHGPYDWPSAHYTRFANLAGLENTADETSRMKAAFANLEIVQELALSMDNGLGWLNGPDRSLKSRIFDRPTPVFGTKYDVADRSDAAAAEFWTALRNSHQSIRAAYQNIKELTLEHRRLSASTPVELDGLRQTIYANSQRWPVIETSKVIATRPESTPSGLGVLYTTGKSTPANDMESFTPALVPSTLRKEQKEWLLETQWAQQAFLESYMLSVIDNGRVFGKVTTLRVTKVSSRFLPMLARRSFWDALPCLADVTLHVAADWRVVEKDNAGLAAIRSQRPSEAVRVLHKEILRDRISTKESIKKLNIGWFGGGEYADGMYARNTNLLPAPITQLDHCTANSGIFGLVFKSVEHLTLYNCWITPPTLQGLVKSHSSKALKKLTLESVSLTAHPRLPPANAQGGAAAQLAPLVMPMQAQNGNHVPPAAAGGFAAHIAQLGPAAMQNATPQQLAVLQQQWNQHMQNMQQLFAANPNVNVNQAVGNLANLGVPLPPQHMPTNAAAPVQTSHDWTHDHREGSWPELIDLLSPGPVFDDYRPQPQPWDEPRPDRPETNLRTIEFISCGYAKLLHNTSFDQASIEPGIDHIHTLSPWFRARWTSLKPLMLETRDRYIGQIVQFMPPRERYALQFAWGLTEGWRDTRKAEDVEFDGLLPGGTGRFSGSITHSMALVGEPVE